VCRQIVKVQRLLLRIPPNSLGDLICSVSMPRPSVGGQAFRARW
jgi:hypothetical protein